VEDAAAAIGPALVEGLSGGGDGVGGGGGGGGCGRTRAVGVALYTLPLVASLGEGEGAEEEEARWGEAESTRPELLLGGEVGEGGVEGGSLPCARSMHRGG
jgi:hypothetical protein